MMHRHLFSAGNELAFVLNNRGFQTSQNSLGSVALRAVK